MMPLVHPALTALSPAERGFVLGAARAGAGAEETARRLAEPAGGRCRAALQALAAAAEPARAAALDQIVAELHAPFPAGLEQLHPGWIRRALEGESSVVVRAIAARLPAGAREVAAEILAGRDEDPDQPPPSFRPDALDALMRVIFGGVSPIAAAPDRPGGRGEPHPAALIEALERRGAIALGHSLAGAPRAVVARAAVGIGEPWARVVVDAASQAITPGARAAARSLVAAVTAAEVARLGAARAIGVRATAAELAGADEAERLAAAQRLPPALGDALLAALAGDGPAEDA
jgi:hypothetical protein